MEGNGVVLATDLDKFLNDLLLRAGFNSQECSAIASSLMLSERLGYSSHGVAQILRYIAELNAGGIVSGAAWEILRETPANISVDAQVGVGQVVMPRLLKTLYAKASNQAVVSGTVRNCGHIGRLGEWVEEPANAGYAALLMVNDNGCNFIFSPPGGKRGVTSTNPIAFSLPVSNSDIFLIDMSTSAIAYGKADRAKRMGMEVPEDCIQDAEGRATTNPDVLFESPNGYIRPMGGAQGYKGFAISMLVDLLVAGLSGGQAPPAAPGTKGENCVVMVIWNLEFYAGIEHMRNEAAKYLSFVRACQPIDELNPIRIPGDRTNAARKRHADSKWLAISEDIVSELLRMSALLSVAAPRFHSTSSEASP